MNEALRRVVNVKELRLRPYDRYGEPMPGMSWHPVSDDRESGAASYFLRFEPGARSRPHEHVEREEFLVLEGELIDSDGRVLKAGDFASYAPGSKHWSHAPKGCLLLVFLRSLNRALAPDETVSQLDG